METPLLTVAIVGSQAAASAARAPGTGTKLGAGLTLLGRAVHQANERLQKALQQLKRAAGSQASSQPFACCRHALWQQG